ncbi:MAG: hypothetical protein DI563_04830 [Variovorax paradoxus]|uniref:Replication-associated protein ORF2/G2P domain-containing protein n=1 Tax=Variovorax paradoxus TaxID=34073 RepID=A0A2W5SBY8_VARPD|nr:MAG: hypothetical protein DI563_04830 [Variovorax paradoxus]
MALRIVDLLGRPVKTVADFDRVRGEVTVLDVTRSGPFRLKATDLGRQLEIVAQREQQAVERDWSSSFTRDVLECMEESRERDAEERAEKSARAAAQRAKKRVRQLSKVNGVDTLLTGTYRANETDLARVKADVKEFNRRVVRVLPQFGMIVAFEPQARGAWHFHAATCRIPRVVEVRKGAQVHRFKSYDLLRSIWRSVTKERGGNIDVARTKGKDRSAARIASYIAKYATKAFAEGEKWSNRWTKFGFTDVPKPVDLGRWENARDVIAAAYELVPDAASIVSGMWSRFGDWLFVASEHAGGVGGALARDGGVRV